MPVSGIIPQTPKVSDVNVDASTQFPIIYDEDVIEQTLDMLFGVTPGERFLIPDYGIDLEKYLFGYDQDIIQHVIITEVQQKLKMYAPFVEIVWNASKVTQDDGLLDIRLTYKLTGKTEDKVYHRYIRSSN